MIAPAPSLAENRGDCQPRTGHGGRQGRGRGRPGAEFQRGPQACLSLMTAAPMAYPATPMAISTTQGNSISSGV